MNFLSVQDILTVNLEKFKAIDIDMSQININFRNQAKNTDDHLYKIKEKLRYLRIENVEEKEAEDENWDQCKDKISSILKSKLKINNVRIERAHSILRRKRNHSKDEPRTIVFKLYSYEGKSNIMRNVYQLKDTDYYIKRRH